jgi:transposase
VREGVVDSNPEAISVYVRSMAPDAVRVGLETGPTSTWLWTELRRLGLPVVCIDARHAKAVLKMQINKSDRNDAIGIARIMQTGWFKEVHVKESTATRSGRYWPVGRCWSRSSATLRTMFAAF